MSVDQRIWNIYRLTEETSEEGEIKIQERLDKWRMIPEVNDGKVQGAVG